MTEMTSPEDKTRGESDQEQFADDDDDDDDDDDIKNKPSANKRTEVHSDDEEQWFDTSPDDIEMRAITNNTISLINGDSAKGSAREMSYGVLRRPGSLIKDDNFEMISLKDNAQRSNT